MRSLGRANHRTRDGVLERRCAQCQKWKPETVEFFYRRNDPPRWQSPCKECNGPGTRRHRPAFADLAAAMARPLAFALALFAVPAWAQDCARTIVSDSTPDAGVTACRLFEGAAKIDDRPLVAQACRFDVVIPDGASRTFTARFATAFEESGDSAPLAVSCVNKTQLPAPTDLQIVAGATGGGPPMGAIATVSFTGADVNPLPSPWTTGSFGSDLQRQSNIARTQSNVTGFMYYDTTTPDDHYSRVVFAGYSNINSHGGPACRIRFDGGRKQFYFMDVYPSTDEARLYRYDYGTSQIGSTTTITTPVAGDVWEIRCVGTTISAWINGVQIISGTNSDLADGQAGMYIEDTGSGGSLEYSDFEVGDFNVAAAADRGAPSLSIQQPIMTGFAQ